MQGCLPDGESLTNKPQKRTSRDQTLPTSKEPCLRPSTVEKGDAIFGPGFVAGHTAIENARVDVLGLGLHIGERGEIHAEVFHGVDIGRIAEQRANIFCEAEGDEVSPITSAAKAAVRRKRY